MSLQNSKIDQVRKLVDIMLPYVCNTTTENLSAFNRLTATSKVLFSARNSQELRDSNSHHCGFAFKNQEINKKITSHCDNITYKQMMLIDIIKDIKRNLYHFIVDKNRNAKIIYDTRTNKFTFRAFCLNNRKYYINTDDEFYMICNCSATYKNGILTTTVESTEPPLAAYETIENIIEDTEQIHLLIHPDNKNYANMMFIISYNETDKIVITEFEWNRNRTIATITIHDDSNADIQPVVDDAWLDTYRYNIDELTDAQIDELYFKDDEDEDDEDDEEDYEDYEDDEDYDKEKRGGNNDLNALRKYALSILKLVPQNKHKDIIEKFYKKYPDFIL